MTELQKNNPEITDQFRENVNARIHFAGVLIGTLLLPFLIYISEKKEGNSQVISCLIYGLCFILTFTLSALFHSSRTYPKRAILKTLDRISIYFLIAASYTPLVAYYLQNEAGRILLITLWTLAFAGIFFEVFLVKKYILISVPFYIIMGCLFVFTAGKFFAEMSSTVITLILAGVILYIAGIFFYLKERFRFSHAVWHSFVLLAALCHYSAIFITAFLS